MAYIYKYPRPAVTADCVVMTRAPHTSEAPGEEYEPKVLLIQRGNEPFKGCWAFPGGFMELKNHGIRMAIVSNKFQAGVDELYDAYFKDMVDVAVGERQGIPRKPAPDMVNIALQELGVSKEGAVYVGDSDVDIMTARNSDLPCISVLWGFRDKDFLMEHGAEIMIETPTDIIPIVMENGYQNCQVTEPAELP